MHIEQKKIEPDVNVLELTGKITLGRESQKIEWTVDELLGKNEKKFIFDLSKIDYVDSSGLGIIVSCSGKVKKAGGSLRVVGAHNRVLQIFKMTGLDAVLICCPTMAEAVASSS
jgi:anti-sigma B factor antagonist